MDVPWRTTATIDEFLEELAFSDEKLEFFDGKIVAFAGGTAAHSVLSRRLTVRFDAAAAPGCTTYTSDMAIRVGDAAYVFPDCSYTCEPFDPRATALVAPLAVVEVVSPSSSRRDRVEKVRAYIVLARLREYLLVDSRAMNVTLFTRDAPNGFSQRDYSSPDDVVALSSLDVRFSLAELYDGVLA